MPVSRKRQAKSRTATHRPATRRRRFHHDDLVAVDLFSGFGGLTKGIEAAGFTTILAANHNPYKVEVHEANHPVAEHWIADLVDPDSSDYHSAADLPAADILVAGISCTNHSQANTQKAYEQGLTLFDIAGDEEYEERVTRSERDRATAICILQYAAKNHPRMILIECTTEFTSWGPAIPGKKIGDGSTYKWWRTKLRNMNYRARVLYLNSQFFGVPQSRDRIYIVFWDESLPEPDLEHQPPSWCGRCDEIVPAVWSWKTGIPPTGSVRWGKQYNYRCPRCRAEVIPPMAPAINALDLSYLGPQIGDRDKPLAPATMARAERCRVRFPEFPGILMPAKATHGVERHPWQPAATQTSQQETALLSTGAVMVAAGNTFERPGSDCRSRDLSQPLWTQHATNSIGLVTPPVALTGHVFAAHRHNGDGQHFTRSMDTVTTTEEKAVLFAAVNNFQGAGRGVDEPLPTQGGSETLSLVSAGVVPFRKNTTPTGHTQPMPTVTAEQIPGLVTAAGTIKNNGSIDEARYRAHPVSDPLGTVVASGASQAVLFSGWYKQNGSSGQETAAHPLSDPFGAITARDTTALLSAEWRAALAEIPLEKCHFRMLSKHEVGRSCAFDVDFPGHQGTFKVWGSARHQVDGFGNAVSPPVGMWIASRMRAVLHPQEAIL